MRFPKRKGTGRTGSVLLRPIDKLTVEKPHGGLLRLGLHIAGSWGALCHPIGEADLSECRRLPQGQTQ